MKNARKMMIVVMAFAAASVFPACAASPIEIDSLPVDLSKIERVIIETPKRNARTVTHVEVKTGAVGSVRGRIRDWKESGDTLTVKLGGDLDVVIPENNDVKLIEVKIASGSILIDGFERLEEIRTASAEGDMTVRNIGYVEEMRLDTTNGDLILENVKADDAEANTISGDILYRGDFRDLELSGLSGRMEVETGNSGRLEMNTTAGHMTVLTDAHAADVDFSTLTGKRNYSHDSSSALKIKAASLSGNLTVTTK